MSGPIAKATILAELKRLKFDDEKTYTAHELKGVGEYLLARRLIRWIESLPDQEKPYCLVTVSGGGQRAFEIVFGILDGVLGVKFVQSVKGGARVEPGVSDALDGGGIRGHLHVARIDIRSGARADVLFVLRVSLVKV